MKKSNSQSARDSTTRLQRAARERADEQARRIPWQRLQQARNQYIEWQEFNLWARSILEIEKGIPDSLTEILRSRCPGFLENTKALSPKAIKTRSLVIRLEDWIDDHVFGFAKQEGWFAAITYYAVRDPRYQRAEVCWSECVEKWKKAKPTHYPSFDEWKAMAAQCDETARLIAEERKVRASARLVNPERLSEAVTRYMDCEALACWARHALERESELPTEVVLELERGCPGYLEIELQTRAQKSKGETQVCERLMLWIADRFFQDAKAEGWFDAVLNQVRSHPRAIRTMEFSDYCGETWGSKLPDPYPSFEEWRRNADSYVDQAVN
ncbi:MAG TPA: hypothetical protein VMT53_18300 [Terriglobales bacterium]|nr:hypothetical protein [Terriglobales bacterium]